MNGFLFLVMSVGLVKGIATPRTVPRGLIASLESGFEVQSSSLAARDLLFEEAAYDDSVLNDEPGFVFYDDLDPLAFAESHETSPDIFDLASTEACDSSQSSLDPFLDYSILDARDLLDEFTDGLREFVAPLNDIKAPACSAPTDPQLGTGSGSGPPGPGQEPEPIRSPLPPPTEDLTSSPGDCSPYGRYGEGYIWALCCDGARVGEFVYGCYPCK
jgi:hypothetical protein